MTCLFYLGIHDVCYSPMQTLPSDQSGPSSQIGNIAQMGNTFPN